MTISILVVDDNPDFIDLYRLILKHAGYDIHSATHGQTALHYVAQHRFDLIVMDVMMPDINGYDVCRKIVQTTQANPVPVIMVSAGGNLDFPHKARQAGAIGCLHKPFSLHQLLDSVRNAISQRVILPTHLAID